MRKDEEKGGRGGEGFVCSFWHPFVFHKFYCPWLVRVLLRAISTTGACGRLPSSCQRGRRSKALVVDIRTHANVLWGMDEEG